MRETNIKFKVYCNKTMRIEKFYVTLTIREKLFNKNSIDLNRVIRFDFFIFVNFVNLCYNVYKRKR